MTEELKRCPFCGGQPRMRIDSWVDGSATPRREYSLRCECGIDLGIYTKQEPLIAQWNKRT